MPAEAKKNVSVILFDLKMESKVSVPILERIILHMSIIRPKDMTRLILLNNSETKNRANYPNIFEVTAEIPYTFDIKKCIEDCEVSNANWLDGLEIAAKNLAEYDDRKAVFTKQLIYITDFQTHLSETDSHRRVKTIINLLNQYDIYLYIIGPETQPSVTISKKEDVKKGMTNFKFKDNSSANDDNQEILKKIIHGVNGIVCGPDLAIDFLTFYVNTIPKQNWEVPLTIENFEFPTVTTRTISPVTLPQLKVEKQGDVKWLVPPDSADGVPQEIHLEDVVKVYSYMDKIITLPQDVNESFKFKGNRMFKLVGFVDSYEIPEMHLDGEEVYTVCVDPDKPRAATFYRLVKSLYETKKYGLALRAYNNNNAPKLYVLIPRPPDQFLMALHAEIVTEVCQQQEPKHNPSDVPSDLLKNFSEYLDEMASRVLPLHPHLTAGVFYNQYLKNVADLIEERTEEFKVNIGASKSNALLALESLMTTCQSDAVKKADELPLKLDVDADDDW